MVLLIIDIQKLIVNNKLYNFNYFIQNVNLLIKTARENNVEVIYVRHDDGKDSELTKGKDGYEIYGEFYPLETERIFDKKVNSPFKESGLTEYLTYKGEKTLMITGLQTDYCIDAAVKCGFEHGFDIIVPAFANTTVDNEFMSGEETYKYYNQFIWNKRYAKTVDIHEAVEIIKNGKYCGEKTAAVYKLT